MTRPVRPDAWTDLRVLPHSRLRYRVYWFQTQPCMRRWCLEKLGFRGAAADLAYTITDPTPTRRHFCTLVFGHPVTLETVAHEAVHVAHAFRARVGRRARWPDDAEEEDLAYPAGRVTQAVQNWLDSIGAWR